MISWGPLGESGPILALVLGMLVRLGRGMARLQEILQRKKRRKNAWRLPRENGSPPRRLGNEVLAYLDAS